MLGRIKTERQWHWSAYGKHPSARDYFRIGRDMPLSKALSDWIERGFEGVAAKDKPASSLCSWRFWTRETRKDHVVCGLLRDSFDAVGRPYPLLITGAGPVPGWSSNWDLVPFVCENAWAEIEYLCTKLFPDVKALEAGLQKIKTPRADWEDYKRKRDVFKGLTPQATDSLKESIHRLSETDPFLCLNEGQYDHFETIDACHRLLRIETESPPSAVFMGGTMEYTCLAFFRRALITSDFVRLWSLQEGQS